MSYLANRQSARLWRKTWPFALLCLLSSTVWLLLDRNPQITFSLASDAIACGLAAVFAIGVTLASRKPHGAWAGLLKPAIGGGLVIAGPAVGAFLHVPINAGSLMIALALTPVVVAVVEGELSAGGLWPGLMATVGLLLVLPEPSLSYWGADLAMLLAPVLTGVGCVVFRGAKPDTWRVSGGLLGGVVVFGLGAMVEGVTRHGLPAVSVAAVAIDVPLFVLSFVALRRLRASQYVARYALVPLLILIQGAWLLWPIVTWRSVICAGLLLVAGVGMLRSRKALNPHRLWG